MNPARVMAMASKEWREIVRDRIFLLLAFLLAPMLMIVFVYGLGQDVEKIPMAIDDEDRSSLSRDYTNRFLHSRYFHVKGYVAAGSRTNDLLAGGAVRLVIVIPPGFQAALLKGRRAEVQAMLDGTFTSPARTVLAYVQAINLSASKEFQAGYLMRRFGITASRAQSFLEPLRMEVRYLYNQEMRISWALAPMLIMLVLTIVVPLLTALTVVREKESGAIYNIYASTATRGEFLAGKLLPNLVIAMVNAVVLWTLAVWYFGVPFKGSMAGFLLSTACYVVTLGSLGLFFSLIVRTQAAAMMATVILSFTTGLQLSGMITPRSSMSGMNAVLADLLPPSHYASAVQAVFLKGAGAADLSAGLIVPALHAVLLLSLSYFAFRKRIRS